MAFQPPPHSSVGSVNPASNVTPLWLAQCQTTKSGTPLNNLHNVLLALRGDPAWVGALAYDQMLCEATLRGAHMEDHHVFSIHEWMQANGLQKASLDTVREAVE